MTGVKTPVMLPYLSNRHDEKYFFIISPSSQGMAAAYPCHTQLTPLQTMIEDSSGGLEDRLVVEFHSWRHIVDLLFSLLLHTAALGVVTMDTKLFL